MERLHPFLHVRKRIVRGLLVVLPLLITIWLLRILFDLVDNNITPLVVAVFSALGSPDVDRWQARVGFPIIGVLLTVLIVYLIGVVTGNITGRRALEMFERAVLRVPVVKSIYGSARQLLDAFAATGDRTFSKVVLVEYPRRGMWTVGFVTNETGHTLPKVDDTDDRSIPVFLPTTPNPTSGWLIMVPCCQLYVLDMSIDAAIKLIVSGGIVSPRDLGPLVTPWAVSSEVR